MDCLRTFAVACLTLISLNLRAATYYVSPTGAGALTGANAANAISLASALTNTATGDTLLCVPGSYSSIGPITNHFQTWQSTTKWGAVVTGSVAAHGIYSSDGYHTNTIDGFKVVNSYIDGIKMNGHGWTVKNNWITGAGKGTPGATTNTTFSPTGQGIASHDYSGHVIERNLIENGGLTLNGDHGLYVNGTNIIIRYNVSRSNLCWGIQVYNSPGDNDNCQVYGNLVYGNGNIPGSGGGSMVIYSYNAAKTNHIYNNLFDAYRYPVVSVGPGTLNVTNNVFFGGSGYNNFSVAGGMVVNFDYNARNQTYGGDPTGANDVTNNTFTVTNWFPGAGSGRYWIPLAGIGRNAALSTLYTPQNWFGSAQTAGADIGPYQYDGYLYTDSRDMHVAGADYWTHPLSFTPPPSAPGQISSSIQSSLVSSNSARISWATDQSATSLVTYNGASTAMDTTLVRYHAVTLSGLTPSTAYNYTVTSTNVNGSITSGTNTFTTLAVGYTTVSTNRFAGGGIGL